MGDVRADVPSATPEPRFKALVDRIGAIVYEALPGAADGDAVFRFVSAGAEGLLGYAPRRWLESPRFWLETVHPDDRAHVLAETARAIRRRETTAIEYRQVTAAGAVLWVRNLVHPEVLDDGSVRVAGVVIDMTASRRAEERLQRAREAADELSAQMTAAEVAQTVAEQGRAAVGAAAVAVFLRVGDVLEPVGYDGHEGVGVPPDCTVPLDREIPIAIAVRTGRPVFVPGSAMPREFPAVGAGRLLAGDGPLAAKPLLVGTGAAIGVLAVRMPSGHVMADADRTLLAVLARTAAQAIVRTRQLEAERDARRGAEDAGRLLDSLISTAPEGYALFDRELRYAKVNQALAEMNGLPIEEHLGRTVAEVIPDVPITALLARVRDEGISFVDLEVEGRNAEGIAYVWLVSYYPVRDAAGEVAWVGAFVVDITQRKRAEQRTRLLAELGAILGEAGTVEARLQRVAAVLIDGFADFATLYLRRPGGALERIVSRHVDPEAERLLATNPPSGGSLLAPAVHRFDDVSEDDYESVAADPIARANHRATGTRSIVTVPMLLRERQLGVVAVASREPYAFDDADIRLLQDVAARAALAVDNARLYAAERDARDRTERQYAVASALADALTPVEVAGALLGELVPAVGADVGVVWRVAEDGAQLEPIGRRGITAAQLSGHERPALDSAAPTPTALRERRARWMASADEVVATYPDIAPALLSIGMESVGVVPLLSAGRPVGGLLIGASDQSAFSGDDQALAMTAAVQAAQALERAGLFDSARRTSVTLQRSLLPRALPEVAGLELGLRYLPAAGLEAGGDFYEALEVGDDGALMVAVGDVVGRGAVAAAAMGQLRSALRAFAQVVVEPAAVLERLSAFADGVGGAMAATAVVASLLPATGELKFACAGHPWPLLVNPDGTAAFLQDGRGVPLGCVPEPTFPVAHARLTPGATLLLYTDGLTERRGTDLEAALERLRVSAAAAGALPLEDLLDAVVADMGDEDAGDDVALVAVRLTGAPTDRHVTFGAMLAEVPAARALVRTWLAELGVTGDDAADLLLATGEAFANAVEHSGATDVRLSLTTAGDGQLTVEVEDSGSWRRPRIATSRGRGLSMMRALVDEVEVESDDEGTIVRLRHAVGRDAPAAEIAPVAAGPAGCRVELADGVARLRGALDLASAATVGDRLAPAMAAGLLVDLTDVDFLDSTGARLLLELGEGGPLRVVAPPGGAPRRTLEISGLAGVLDLLDARP